MSENMDEKKELGKIAGYELISIIGSGTYGTVFKAVGKDGNKYALKMCSFYDHETALFAEALIAMQVEHQNIITCYDIILRPNKIIFVMEYADNSLLDLISRGLLRDVKSATMSISHVLEGLSYLKREFGISHCDLTPSNILYSRKKGIIKITDFNSIEIPNIVASPGTTRWYAAPETIKDKKFSEKSDIWSLGCIYYEILTGNVLFRCSDNAELMEMIERTNLSELFTKTFPEDSLVRNLLEKMLIYDYNKRLGIEEVQILANEINEKLR